MHGGFTTASGIEVIRDSPDAEPDGSGKRVVFVHGAMDRASSFGRTVRHLTDLCTDRYDRRGYGRSLRLGTGDVAQHTADLIEVLGDERATVVGHSLGGLVAVMAAAERSDLVERVVAYEPPAPWTSWWAAGHHDVLDRADPGDAAEAFLRRMLGDRTWERFPPTLRLERRAEGPALQADLAIGRADPKDFDPSSVSVPVLVACGDDASPRHRRAAEAMAQDVPGGRLVELAGADHGAHLSHPKSFADLVRAGLPQRGRAR